ncbi:MAG: T9SS type A sorting domain-containing protein [Crocinitomicaceae bacterium]
MKKPVILITLFLLFNLCALGATAYVTPSGAGAMDGTSWADAYPATALQTAIDASGIGDEVWVAAGTYHTTTSTDRSISFSMRNGLAIYGSFAGTETQLSERNLSNGLTSILSGEIGGPGTADNSYKVIYNQQLDSTAVIDGFIIEYGNDNRSPTNSGDGLGGGMCNDGYNTGGFCDPVIRHCLFRNNIASWGAGAFNNGYGGGSTLPTYINCVFAQNHALIEAGGMDTYAVGGTGSPTVINTIFYENTSSTNVGAMYAWGGSGGDCQPVLINCAFINNSAMNGYGGAFIADNLDPSGGGSSGTCIVTLQNCIVRNNTTSGSPDGPQFYVRGTGAQVLATYSDIDMTGQNAPHVISGSGVGNIDLDPLFEDIADGVGLDGVWMTSDDGLQLLYTSPCIDAGDNSGVAEVDLLFNPRILYSTVDMGAYEYGQPTGAIDENSLILNVEVFPNPTSDVLNLSFQNLGKEVVGISLTDIHGRRIKTIFSDEDSQDLVEYQVDVSNLESGVYFMIIQSNTAQITKRFVKNP